MGARVVPSSVAQEWHQAIVTVQRREIDRTIGDLEAFTWQFDYQTEKKTPESARDAVPRAVQRLAGYRAHVRAMVNVQACLRPEVPADTKAHKLQAARRMLAMAWTYARTGANPERLPE